MKPLSCLCLLLGVGAALPAAADTRPPPPPEAPRSQFVFSLMPKSFQSHPRLDFHVISEMTEAGRKLAEPTSGHPVYYLAQAGKFRQLGNNTSANEHPPAAQDLTRAMETSLAASNYLPATPKTPLPTIVVVFNYGSFARFSTEAYDMQQSMALQQAMQSSDPNAPPADAFLPSGDDRDVDSLLPMVLANPQDRLDVLQRAELIGGDKFAAQLAKALDQEALYKQSASTLMPSMDNISPFHQFMNSSPQILENVEETFSSCYFVIASAYDYVQMRQGKRVLLWRTKMTVNSLGISMTESMPSLVLSAGPYFGRDMTNAVTLTRRVSREGKVEVGTPTVVDYAEPSVDAGAKSPAPASSPVKK